MINTSILPMHPKWVLIDKMAVDRDLFILHICTAESPHADMEVKREKNRVVITDHSDTKQLSSPTT
jgi:hypothetical protein